MAKSRKSRQRTWTEQDVARLMSLAKRKMTAARIAHALHRSLYSTKQKASRLGISMGARERWTKEEVRRLKKLAKQYRSLPRIAKSMKRTIFAIERVASKHGISLDFRD